MQCPYCKMENVEGAANCAVCRLPLAAPQAEQPDGIWLIPPASGRDAANRRPSTLAEQVEVLQVPEEETDDPEERAADRWLPRLVFFIGIFIVGLGIGLSGSNWFKLANDVAAAREDVTAKPEAGVSRRYLLEDDAAPTPARQRHEALLDDEPASSTSAVPAPPAPVSAPLSTPAPVPALARPPDSAGAAALAPDSAKSKPVPKRRSAARQKKVAPSPVPAAAASVRSQPAKRPHRNGSRNSSKKAPPSYQEPTPQQEPQPGIEVQLAEMKSGSKRLLLNQCENRESWIEREKCKWHICSNQWGQHGCPAYPAPQHQQ